MDNLTIVQMFFREDITTPWFHEIIPREYPDHTQYMIDNYTGTNDLVITKELSEDKHILVFTLTHASVEVKEKISADEYIASMVNNRSEYNENNNITDLTQ